jgi:ectoine hydroxylase-related dioxygenase (phytanoyl-CoA dioxygenase family)
MSTLTSSERAISATELAATPDYARFYRQHGYLVLPDALSEAEVTDLCQEAAAICRGERGAITGVEPAGEAEEDDAVMRRYLCIHFPHKVSPKTQRYLAHPAIVDVLTKIIGPNVKCMQSMLFMKAAGKPGQAWHQDEDFIPTRDRSLTGAWIALDDATTENGCLWVIPGSHQHGVLWPMKVQNDYHFDCTDEAFAFPYRDEDAVPVEVSAGSVVFFNGYTLHRSLPNRAKHGYRRALVNHYMSAESLLPWFAPKEGERMALTDSRDIVMVAGHDPYAYKGLEDVHRPAVRPSGEGGCFDGRQKVKPEGAS